MIVAKVIDTHAAWQAVWTAAAAGVGVTLVFAVAVLGATRSADTRRAGRVAQSGVFGVLALLATAATFAAVIYAITLVTTK